VGHLPKISARFSTTGNPFSPLVTTVLWNVKRVGPCETFPPHGQSGETPGDKSSMDDADAARKSAPTKPRSCIERSKLGTQETGRSKLGRVTTCGGCRKERSRWESRKQYFQPSVSQSPLQLQILSAFLQRVALPEHAKIFGRGKGTPTGRRRVPTPANPSGAA